MLLSLVEMLEEKAELCDADLNEGRQTITGPPMEITSTSRAYSAVGAWDCFLT